MTASNTMLLFSALCGSVFGFAMEKGKLVLPDVIYAQFTWQSFVMLKAFLTSAVFSIAAFVFMTRRRLTQREVHSKTTVGTGLAGGYGANILGGALIGAGMVVAGSCPGTVYAQLGAGVPLAGWVLAGGVLGSALYGATSSYLQPRAPRFGQRAPGSKLESHLGVSHMTLAVLLGTAMASLVLVLEYLVPWQADIARFFSVPTRASLPLLSPQQPVWPPIVAGVVMGSLQLPTMVLAGHALGASRAFATLWYVLAGWVERISGWPARKHAEQARAWPQVVFAVGSVVGAWLSSWLSGTTITPDMVSATFYPARSFVGGVLLLFGARLAGGCTSGHGLSGMGQLSTSSLITTASLFGSALATGLTIL